MLVMTRPTEHDVVARALLTEAFIRVVVDLKPFDVTPIELALIVRAVEPRLSPPPPFRRPEVLAIRHGSELLQSIRRRAPRLRRRLPIGLRLDGWQGPNASHRVTT